MSKLKTVFMISPDYLESAFTETEKFSFELQGYGNFVTACKRLPYVNFTDVLGFVYLCNHPCLAGSKEYDAMLDFFRLCNLSGTSKKFLIVSKDNLNDLIPVLKKYNNIRFSILSSIEFITDKVFNKDIFGSILLDNYEPYIFRDEKPVSLGDYSIPALGFQSVIPAALFDVEEKVYVLENLSDTLENDVILSKYEGNKIIQKLREIVILKTMGMEYEKAADDFRKLIEKLDNKMYGVYLAFLDIVVGGG